ncbi:MAG TPA: discoidin domain-containing protein, partial [Anaerolineales bacterium]
MKPASEHDEHDREIIELLKGLGQFKSRYPSELLAARRAAFLARVEQLTPADAGEVWSAEDHEIINLLGDLRSAQAEYPPELLAARRSALLQQIEYKERVRSRDKARVSLSRKFQSRTTIPTLLRFSFIVAGLLAVVLLRSLFFPGTQQTVPPLPLQPAAVSTGTGEAAINVCKPSDTTFSCPAGELDPAQDLADPGNGAAQPAVSSEARSNQDRGQKAAYANDGLGGTSWVSSSPDGWIKIDLGQVATINTVSLQKGSAGSSRGGNPG